MKRRSSAALLRAYLDRENLSQNEFSKRSGIHFVLLSRILGGSRGFTTTTALKVQKATSGVIKATDLVPELAGLVDSRKAG